MMMAKMRCKALENVVSAFNGNLTSRRVVTVGLKLHVAMHLGASSAFATSESVARREVAIRYPGRLTTSCIVLGANHCAFKGIESDCLIRPWL